MITLTDFEDVATARLEDSIVLAMFDRYDGARYLCGFAVEIALKIKISKENNLPSFPETDLEFKAFPIKKIRTHDLVKLRNLSSSAERILKTNRDHQKRFDLLRLNWTVDYRYKKLSGAGIQSDCLELIEAAEYLLKVIL
jgi:hypothetical protein